MIYYLRYKEDGEFDGFMDEGDYKVNKETMIAISEELWVNLVTRVHSYKVDLTKVEFGRVYENADDIFTTPVLDPAEVLAKTKLLKINELDLACTENITDGFFSSAVGEEHFYRFNKSEDQLNFNQQLTLMLFDSTIETIYWKTQDVGVLPHTRDQFIQVAKVDAAIHKQTCISKYWQLKAYVSSLTTIEEVQAVNWVYIR